MEAIGISMNKGFVTRAGLVAFIATFGILSGRSPTCPSAELKVETHAAVGTVRVAAVQFISRWAKPADNRKGLERLIREAAKKTH